MNIKIFLLTNDHNSYAKRLAPELSHLFAQYLPPQGGIWMYPSVREAAASISQAFTDSHAILFFAEPERFAETKSLLASSVGLQLHCEPALLEQACATAQTAEADNSVFALTHAYIPDNARAIACADALYTGFAVSSGNQTVILLPLERGRTEVLLTNSVLPQLNSSYMAHIDIGSLKRYHAEQLRGVCEANDIRIAVAGTNTADYFRDYIAAAEGLADRVSFAAKAEKRGSLSPADYVVNLSITAAEFFGTPYGVAISNAFYSGSDPSGEKIIYLAITNEYETALREVRSVPGEDVPDMLARCCGDLCTFICDIAATDAEKRAVSATNEKSLVSQYKKVIAVVATLATVLAVFAGVYFTMHGYTLKAWASNAWSTVFPGSKPIFTSEPETVADTTETETATAATTKKAVLTTGSATTQQTTAVATTAAQTTKASSSGSSSGSSSTTRASTYSTEAPATEPSTEAPSSSQEPSSEEPSSQEPSSEEPSSEEPSSEEPSSEEPGSGSEEENNNQSPGPDSDPGTGEQEE